MFAGLLVLAATLATGTHLAVGQAEQRLDRLGVEGQSAAWRQTLANEWQRMRAEATAVTRNEALIGALRDDAGIRTYADPLYNRLRAGGIADRIVVVDAQGDVRYDSADNHGERVPLARAALEDGRFHEGLHHVPGERVYAGLAIPVYRGGNPIGAVVQLRDLSTSALESMAEASGGRAALLDERGPLALTAPFLMSLAPGERLHQQAAASRVDADGRHSQLVYLPLVPFDGEEATATVVLARDLTESVATQNLINATTYVAAFGMLVLIAGGLYLWLGRTLRPMRRAMDTLDRIGHGDFQTDLQADSRVAEIARLQEVTRTMAGRLGHIVEIEEENARLAFRDALTDLPNRRLLLEHLEHAIHTVNRTRRHAALLLIDLDNFKTLNDTCGHSAGDRLLQALAQRFTARLRDQDIVARLGGDEFVALLEELSPDRSQAGADAQRIAGELLKAMREPVRIDDIEHVMSGSIGITLFPRGFDTPEELLKQADFAMYQAKQQGRNGVRFYDPAMQRTLLREAELERKLRRALQGEELVIHLQPQVDPEGRILGAEALMRWPQPDGSWISPGEFIPVAEHTGQILEVGRLALQQACHTLRAWQGRPVLDTLPISVNLSPHHLRQPRLMEEVTTILDETGAAAQRLHIEVTESVMADASQPLIANLEALRARGVALALDDFGTGYSSLGYLKRLPLDVLKIDRSFVQDIEHDADDANIVATIAAIAHNMGLSLIAEGVENEAQRDFLVRHGCHRFQGYLYHHAMPVADFEALVAAGTDAADHGTIDTQGEQE
ncbi:MULTISPECIES: bifunctional diguanylate cyclase/phosphodiesterase [unclassified Thioalkalivibrio]|uniref:putative bifunctional diguanylate cyclase/phosphodiesterase n=1 Tax=unclassified Thioalkalivibrio TaxID=2621013 RepID=UPI0003A5312A|nr:MULTISPECIES: EAL domain-containing protein [unclassified Thioalkalivibrio]